MREEGREGGGEGREGRKGGGEGREGSSSNVSSEFLRSDRHFRETLHFLFVQRGGLRGEYILPSHSKMLCVVQGLLLPTKVYS